ncbi:DUF501 domain-containing protein [Streptomyces sp. HPF1205]|uniref:DUF501 domain-containing protein n=1 Tax=Streptomyces sp. HPF1205 TaxID=2873262 RepID=UPI001CED021D|nr:DUF501 domain-containing protein [Streptomyces sp. HPF1205]
MDNQAHPTPHAEPASAADIAAVHAQLGRPPRGLRAVAHRCPCGNPDVVETQPRLEDGTPFPTLYYLTCPRAASAIGTLEADGVMKRMTARLAEDPPLATAYRAAHEDYIARRDAIEVLEGFPSAGGMPDRVKCLHVLAAHSLAAGPGVNPLGDETVAMLPDWWAKGPCVPRDAEPHDDQPRDEQPQHSRPQDRAGTRPEKGDRA